MDRAKRSLFVLVPVLGALLWVAPAAVGQVVPAGLSPGDKYHLAFITQDGRDATSTDIADYNAFVQAQAGMNTTLTGAGVTYRAIVSTAAVDANANAVIVASPAYLLDGTTKIADDFTDMWDGDIDAFLKVDQFGVEKVVITRVWTGTAIDGTVFLPGMGGVSGIINGTTASFGSGWIFSSNNQARTTEFPLYALSEELTVPTPPTPSALPTSSLPGLILLAAVVAGTGALASRTRRLSRPHLR